MQRVSNYYRQHFRSNEFRGGIVRLHDVSCAAVRKDISRKD
ncbi:MAG: hypothetical protein PUA94_08310 [Bacteroidales bacterium]|nr:hypothetical protein [Bacteroidales bacterium]